MDPNSYEAFRKKFTERLDEERDFGWHLGFVHGMLIAGGGLLAGSWLLRAIQGEDNILGWAATAIFIGSMPISIWQLRKAQKRVRDLMQGKVV